jgi:hypothetical protein
VADLGCWIAKKIANGVPPEQPQEIGQFVNTTYATWYEDSGESAPNAVAVAVATLLVRMGWEDPSVRPLADYFRWVGLAGPMKGQLRGWAVRDVYSAEIAAAVEARGQSPGGLWDEWSWPIL